MSLLLAVTAGGNVSVTPPTATLVLTGYAPSVLTPQLVTPGVRVLVLTGFAPTIALPLKVTPATRALVLTGFAPAVQLPLKVTPAVKALILTGLAPAVQLPLKVTPGVRALVLATFAPTVTISSPNLLVTPATVALVLTGFAPSVQGDKPLPTEGSGGGKLIRIFRDTEKFAGPPLKLRPYTNLPSDPLPEQAPLTEPILVNLQPDNPTALIALFEDGALTEDEFVALLAA